MIVSWNEIFNKLGPAMIDEASEGRLLVLVRSIAEENLAARRELEGNPFTGHQNFRSVTVKIDDYETIKIQLRALGLMTKSTKARSLKDSGAYWTLTPYGDQVLTTMRAIPRQTREAGELPRDKEGEIATTAA